MAVYKQEKNNIDKLTKRVWLIFFAVVVCFSIYWCLSRAYSPKNIKYREDEQCYLLESFLEEQAKEEYGKDWYKYCIVDEVTVEDHKWYELNHSGDEWVFRVTFKTSDDVKYYNGTYENYYEVGKP